MFMSKKPGPKLEAFIGPETEIEGSVRTTESIRIDGKIKGSITAESVVLGENAYILGDITASKVTVGGKIKGNVSAASHLELLPKGAIFGDIRTSRLVIADGACFEGNCQMLKNDGQIIEMNPDGSLNEQKHLKVVAGNGKR